MATIRRAYVRHYSDTNQTVAYVDWADGKRTVGIVRNIVATESERLGAHMKALFDRARREGITVEYDTW